MSDATLQRTVLHAAHGLAGGRMVAFSGYDMPVQYRDGVLAEHRWTREHAGLFDVSHMGPAFLVLSAPTGDGEADHAAVAALIEPLVCGDIRGLKPGQLRYTLLMNAEGGIEDDLMIGRPHCPTFQGTLYIVVNAGTKEADFTAIAAAAGERATLHRADAGGLLALQGPEAAEVMREVAPWSDDLAFMQFRGDDTAFGNLTVARSGYTGEDGFEILVAAEHAPALWSRLLQDARVKPVGLGARDSLRLEAGLPLYGHDIDSGTSPIEANLAFAVSKRRREAADFPGAARVLRELADGPPRLRTGLRLAPGGAPAREGAEVTDASGAPLGKITSGGPSPSLGGGVAMAYLPPDHAMPGAELQVVVRGKAQAAQVAPMPFHPHRYHRKPAKA